ncbi:acyltransferase family protein [Sphingomonas bacterium]|uniref:acyltransferase family protein n=1 Tax=Sphingomonas bacterium TaxID=1895847 RepID=UPI001576FE87
MVLDGMRGIAAAIVLIHHVAPATTRSTPLPHGYLAVDFFFMLSGFVLSRSYEERFRRGMSFGAFAMARIRRLYPVMALALVIGAVAAWLNGMPLSFAGMLLVAELLFLPVFGDPIQGVFVLVGVQWSLFWELVANAAHHLLLRRLGPAALVAVIIAGLSLLIAAVALHGSLAIGDRAGDFLGGLPRVTFSYVIGVLLARLQHLRRPSRRGVSGPATLAGLTLLLIGAGWAPAGAAELAIVLVGFPVLIVAGARARLPVWAERSCAAEGVLSYPLYALHLPVMNLTRAILRDRLMAGAASFALVLMLAVSAAFLAAIVLDRRWRRWPARRYLANASPSVRITATCRSAISPASAP